MKARLLFIIAAVSGFVSCSKDPEKISERRKENLISDTWKVEYFFNKDHERTPELAGLAFDFSDNGTLTVSGNGSSYSGSWMLDSSDDNKLYLNISGTAALLEINDDWELVRLDNNKMELEDLGNRGKDMLHFVKQ